MPIRKTSKQGSQKLQENQRRYDGELRPLYEGRSGGEPSDMAGSFTIYLQFHLTDLEGENDQATLFERADRAQRWLEEKGRITYLDPAAIMGDMRSFSVTSKRAPGDVVNSAPICAGATKVEQLDREPDDDVSNANILKRLGNPEISDRERQHLVCLAELLCFSRDENEELLKLLWQYIADYRDRNDAGELIAVCSAIRKVAAIMPMDRMEDLAELIEVGHRAAPSIDLEIEVAKMVYRNCEVHPPPKAGRRSKLTEQLWQLAQDYINPRFLPREKYPTAASLAVEALIAMRSSVAEIAWRKAIESPYRWFGDIINDHTATLRDRWAGRDDLAVAWLDDLRRRVTQATQRLD